MKTIGIITTVLLSIVFAPIWRGFAFSKLWLWFVVSTFGATPLGIAQSIGIGYVVGFLTKDPKPRKKEERQFWEEFGEALTISALYPAFALLFGWIIKHFL